jgi:hypothetical protein
MARDLKASTIESSINRENHMHHSDQHNQLEEPTIIQHAHEWLNEHGQPSYSYLMNLAELDTVEAHDELMELAQVYDIAYDPSATSNELVEKIRLHMDAGGEVV